MVVLQTITPSNKLQQPEHLGNLSRQFLSGDMYEKKVERFEDPKRHRPKILYLSTMQKNAEKNLSFVLRRHSCQACRGGAAHIDLFYFILYVLAV